MKIRVWSYDDDGFPVKVRDHDCEKVSGMDFVRLHDLNIGFQRADLLRMLKVLDESKDIAA